MTVWTLSSKIGSLRSVSVLMGSVLWKENVLMLTSVMNHPVGLMRPASTQLETTTVSVLTGSSVGRTETAKTLLPLTVK